jgi:hypothetical protein
MSRGSHILQKEHQVPKKTTISTGRWAVLRSDSAALFGV